MHVHLDKSVRQQIDDIYYYNFQYSIKNAFETDIGIYNWIDKLEESPYLGRYIPEMSDKRFREVIYRRTRYSGYRIMYYISKFKHIIYIINIMNCKQDFNQIL